MDYNQLHTMGKLGAQSFKVGETRVTVIADGFLPIGVDLLQGIDQAGYSEQLTASFVDEAIHHTGVNAFLIEAAGRVILVDTGTGEAMGPDLGKLGATLASIGVAPSDVDTLIATHLHPDHVGGAGLSTGNPFTSAEFLVHGADIDMWCSVDVRDSAPEAFQPFFDLARATVASFGDRVKTIDDGASLGPGMTAVHLPGHTPGHTGVMIENGGQQLLIFADIVHVPPVQFARPEVTIGFDADPDQARATRQRVFDMIATDRLWIAGSHITFPGMGHLETASEGGFRFVPSLWQYT
ncbi:MAG: MBL fold metallo-hydrolase [Pseudomonadota bacterium]